MDVSSHPFENPVLDDVSNNTHIDQSKLDQDQTTAGEVKQWT